MLAAIVLAMALFAQPAPQLPNTDYVCHVEVDRSFECGKNAGDGQVDRSQLYVVGCIPSDDSACKPRVRTAPDGTPYVDECPAGLEDVACWQFWFPNGD